MPTHTATVETLTAQVRVLQVGNKQVTASMAKQLVQVNLMEIEEARLWWKARRQQWKLAQESPRLILGGLR